MRSAVRAWFPGPPFVCVVAGWMALAAILPVGEAFAQGGRERGRASSTLAQRFTSSATRIREGRVMLVSALPPERARGELGRIVSLCRTIDSVFSGMRADHDADLLEVWVVEDRDTYLGVLSTVGGTDGGNSGGMFVRDGDDTRVFSHGWHWSTIQHECWHACRHIFIPDMPVWLDEGLAEIFARGGQAGADFAIGAISAEDIRRTNELIRTGGFEPIGIFMQRGAQWDDRLKSGDPAGRVQYVQAWAIVHYLLFADGGRHRSRINGLLRNLDRGRSGQSAVASAIGSDRASLTALERGIVEYFAKASPFDPAARHAALSRWAARNGAPKDLESAIASLVSSGVFGPGGESLLSRLGKEVSFEVRRGDKTTVVRIGDEGGTVWIVSWPSVPPVPAGTTGDPSGSPPPTVRWALR